MTDLLPYALSTTQVVNEMNSSQEGLTFEEVQKRLEQYGTNETLKPRKTSRLKLLLNQFRSSIVILLFVAALISMLFGDYIESLAIMSVIFLNAIIGYTLDSQAIKSMEALKRLDKTYATVIREGMSIKIESLNIVPGDIISIEAGDVVPSDARLLQSSYLQIDESTLTGESLPIDKSANALLDDHCVLADRINMVYKGTFVNGGNARALVTATGASTELGAIGRMVEEAEDSEIPLNKRLNTFSNKLIWLTIALIAIFVGIGIARSYELYLVLETAIALAVAAIPEGLPIVATISLAKGVMKMSKSNVIVKRLAALEALGETDLILTDKTGTLTENQLCVDEVQLANNNKDAIKHFIKVAVLCNNASINKYGRYLGDPVETALLNYVQENYADEVHEIGNWWKRVEEKPFDSASKYMVTLSRREDNQYLTTVKGSPKDVLSRCDNQFHSDTTSLEPLDKVEWEEAIEQIAKKGLKVLGFAYRDQETDAMSTNHLTFIGLVGFLDPPRLEASMAIAQCQSAGIKVVMVTGDHPSTSATIGQQIGLIDDYDSAYIRHGKDLDINHDNGIDQVRIFARVTPEQKLHLVDYYQSHGYTIGMTGDGVNDAPALKKAAIGIAMGKGGTQVAEEASDIVLMDDSFASIVKAVRQGRIIYSNIKNFIIYLLSCNLTEIMVVSIAAFTNVSQPLLPLQILFLNIVTDIFPALALGMGEGAGSIMSYRPSLLGKNILRRRDWIVIFTYAVVMTISILALFYYSIFVLELSTVQSNNVAFFTLAISQLWHPFNLIRREKSVLNNEIVRNKYLWSAIVLCLMIIFAAYLIPVLSSILSIVALEIHLWVYILLVSVIPLFVIRLLKLVNIIK